MPPGLEEVLARFRRVLIPELNLGQLSRVIRADFLIDARSMTSVRGRPFKVRELTQAFLTLLKEGE